MADPRLHDPEWAMACARGDTGYSLLEVLVAMTLVMVLAAAGLAWGGAGLARLRGEAAARRVATWFARARMEAAQRGRSVGVRFDRHDGRVRLQLFADGSRNGVRLADIEDGFDPEIGAAWFLDDDYPGVRYEIGERLPEIDGSGWLEPGSDPIRVGGADVLTFTPFGTASGGTVYVRGKDGAAYAIRVLGATARTRVLRYEPGTRSWTLR